MSESAVDKATWRDACGEILPEEAIEAVRLVLARKSATDADAGLAVTRSLPHGHVAAVAAQARGLGFPALLGPPCRERDLAYALVISRVARPASKLSTISWWDDVTLGPDLGVAEANTDEVYAATDWLLARQDAIEAELARRHLRHGGMALFDLSSSWVEGSHCGLAALGNPRDAKPQIEYGLLTARDGCPIAVRVFPASNGDPKTFIQVVEMVRDKLHITEAVMVGRRGMITRARIRALKQIPGVAWITCLRAPAIKKLADEGGPLRLGLPDTPDLAEVSSPDYPGERLIAWHNPVLAAERSAHRQRLLAATETEFAKITRMVEARRLADPAKIDAEAALDGIYIIRTAISAAQLDAVAAVAAYKNLAQVGRDFRISKDDLDLRAIWHRLDDRIRAHVLICMLACYVSWHLRKAWAPLTYTDERPPARDNPLAPACRSPAAEAEASCHIAADGQPARSFRDLLGHLATLTRQTIVIGDHQLEKITTPTPAQRQAFGLLGAPIPITLQ